MHVVTPVGKKSAENATANIENTEFGGLLKKKRKRAILRKSQSLKLETPAPVEQPKPVLPVPEVHTTKKAKKMMVPAASPIVLPEEPKPVILTQSAQVRIAEEKDSQTTFQSFGSAWFE